MTDEIEDMDTLNPKARGLGRGLNALFDDEEEFSVGDDAVGAVIAPAGKTVLGVEEVYPGQAQPRHVFDAEPLEQLAQSIREHGVLQPLVVREKLSEAGAGYEIIAGERRWRAAQMAQLHEVPVVVVEMDDTQALEVALIENLQREDLNPIDEALGYQRLMSEYGHTQEKLAEALGKSRSHIANMVRLLNLPPAVQEMVADNGLSMGHARALITAKDAEGLARRVIADGLSVRETEKLAAEVSVKPHKRSKASSGGVASGKDADTLALEKDISDSLGMVVSIDSKNGKSGRVSIDFKTLDQLDVLLQRLAADQGGSRLAG